MSGPRRNGSASDSRSEGWEFESLWPHLRRGLLVARPPCPDLGGPGFNSDLEVWQFPPWRGYGAAAARLTPDQKVGSSNLSGLMTKFPVCLQPQSWNGKSLLRMSRVEQRAVGSYKFFLNWQHVCNQTSNNEGHVATATCLTPDQRVGSSNLSGLMTIVPHVFATFLCIIAEWSVTKILTRGAMAQRQRV